MLICGKQAMLTAVAAMILAGCGGGEESTASGASNLAPIIAGSPVTTLAAGSLYSFTPTAADPDNDALSFSASNVPGWAQFNKSTGALTGTPAEANVGSTGMIQIEVSDGHAIAQLPAFTINVTSNASTPPPANVAPTISGVPATTAAVGRTYTFQPVGADANDDALTFTITNRPSWLTFTPDNGRVSGTPTSANIGSTGPIIIVVSDGQASAQMQFTITVQDTAPSNRAPSITGTPAASVTAGSNYSFTPVGSDPDGNTLSYTIQNKPSWASFSASTGRLSGRPTTSNVGTSARITITTSDGTLSASLPEFTIQVVAPANRAPTISGSPLTSVLALLGYQFQPSASDADGDPLTFSIQNRPAWATFNSATGSLSGTPTLLDVASYSNIIISVSDSKATASLPAFSLAVLQVANGMATLSWDAPITNVDGTALTTPLSGYRLAYGQSQDSLTQTVTISNPSLTTYTVNNLASGTWYFALYAVSSGGTESEASNTATKSIN